ESGFAHATILQEGGREPLVRETRIVYEAVPEAYETPVFHPLSVFIVFLLVTFFITYRDIKRKRLSVGFDSVLFGVLGVLGIVLLLLWTATNHQAAARNLNLLWALPTHLIAAIAFVRQPRWLKPYFLVVAVLSGLLLITWPI